MKYYYDTYTVVERIMSDVYADVRYYKCIDIETGEFSEEDEIIVKCDYIDENISRLLNQFKTGSKSKLNFYKDSKNLLLLFALTAY